MKKLLLIYSFLAISMIFLAFLPLSTLFSDDEISIGGVGGTHVIPLYEGVELSVGPFFDFIGPGVRATSDSMTIYITHLANSALDVQSIGNSVCTNASCDSVNFSNDFDVTESSLSIPTVSLTNITIDTVTISGDVIDDFAQQTGMANADSTNTDSDSGLEVVNNSLVLLRGCDDNQILKWDETNDDWNCEADGGGGGSGDIERVGDCNSGECLVTGGNTTHDTVNLNEGNISNVGQIALDTITSDGNDITMTPTNNVLISDGKRFIVGHTTNIQMSNNSPFQILGASGAKASMGMGRWSNSASGVASYNVLKSRNATVGSHTIVQDNDKIGQFKFLADDNVDFDTQIAVLSAEVDDANPASGVIGGAFVFATGDGASATPGEKMRLAANGNLTVGSSGTALAKVGIDGNADEIQLLVQGHSTQTSDLWVLEESDGTDIATTDTVGMRVAKKFTAAGVVQFPSLADCATIKTNSSGIASCDPDDGGAEVNNLETITTDIAINEVPTGTGANTVVYKLLPDCNVAGSALNYEDSTQTWSCRSGFASGSSKFTWILRPQQGKLPTTAPMGIDAGNDMWRGTLDDGVDVTDESARWETILFPYDGGTLQGKIFYTLQTTSSSDVAAFDLLIECKSDGDTGFDTDSFGTTNSIDSPSQSLTADVLDVLTDTSLNEDSCAQYDHIVVKVFRDVSADGVTDDIFLHKVIIEEL